MKLTIFGATGGTGTCLAEQALAAGHDVTAVVRDPTRLTVRQSPVPSPPAPLPPALQRNRAITADIMDTAAIIPAVAEADVVLTAIGPSGTGVTTVSQDSVRSIIAAMQKAGARRLLTVSGSIVSDEGESPYLRYLLKPVARRTFLRHVCADMRAAEAEVEATDLDWTIMRPPRLTGGTCHRPLPHAGSTAASRRGSSPCPGRTWPRRCSRRSATRRPSRKAHRHREPTSGQQAATLPMTG